MNECGQWPSARRLAISNYFITSFLTVYESGIVLGRWQFTISRRSLRLLLGNSSAHYLKNKQGKVPSLSPSLRKYKLVDFLWLTSPPPTTHDTYYDTTWPTPLIPALDHPSTHRSTQIAGPALVNPCLWMNPSNWTRTLEWNLRFMAGTKTSSFPDAYLTLYNPNQDMQDTRQAAALISAAEQCSCT